ncbi:hypothetical protein GGI02_000564 [Coemansia sp. RSA 2322]|nr:hypothetical protein GGI02_000564 [Coemansia sp. RSA 2322]
MNKALDALNTSHYWLPTVSDIVERNGLSHTKYAHIQIAYSALLSGKLASLLSQAPYCHAVFPQVSSVQLSFTKGGALYGFEDSKCIDSVDRFVKQTRAMFPNATLYSISNTAHCLPEEVNMTKHYNMLVSKLTKDISQIKYYTASDLFNVSAALSASALTHLVYSECSGVNYFIQLIKCNANTLQSLCLDLEHPDKLACILQSNDGMQVTYPCLSALKTVCAGDAVATRRATLMHAPVPNLVNLTMTHSYPFTNDALFRGNYSRLRQLSLQLDIIDLLILEKSGVMERQRFPNLAELEVDLNLVDQPFNACFGQKNLRFLTISGFPLSLRETVGLLRRLPNLSQLILDPYTEEVDDEDEEAELIHRAAEVQYMQELLSEYSRRQPVGMEGMSYGSKRAL